MQSFMSVNIQCSYPTHIKILVESGIDNTSSNISTIPITILTTILYTIKIQVQYWNKFLYQYCDRQVQDLHITELFYLKRYVQ